MCESPAHSHSKRNVPHKINGDLDTKESGGSVTDKKTDRSSKYLHKSTEVDDFDLVPSSLPNASPTEVVNEWLKSLPAEGELEDVEEFNENCDGPKTVPTTEEINTADTVNNPTENSKGPVEGEAKKCLPNNDCETSKETPKEDNASTDADNASTVFNSSIQVMKVLLNPKLDRCNSLPEISPAYGRKLSSSARGFLDCLVKLQLIDHDPKNANEKNERYQELMGILQSLWLCDPPENEHALRKDDHHFADDDFNHTSSSGVDVNSGSTGSGNSSDGVKSGNDVNGDVSEPHATVDMFKKVQQGCEVETDADVQSTSVRKAEGMCEDEQKEDYPASSDSPREQSETPHSSNESARNFSEGQKLPEAETDSSENSNSESLLLIEREELAKMISQDDPAWVLTLLNKIEKQFMTHYIKAMNEFKTRWNLGDSEQLDSTINELRAEVHKRIQASIDRELWKIQGQKGQPRPPRETKSRVSTTQAEERRRKLKVNLKPSTDSHAEKSDDSATGTSYSDQRSENGDECCQCESCIKKKMTCRTPLQGDSMTPVPAATAIKCASHPGNIHETQAAETLVEKVIVKALREVREVHPGPEDISEFAADEKEADDMSQDAVRDEVSEKNDAKEHVAKEMPEKTVAEENKEENDANDIGDELRKQKGDKTSEDKTQKEMSVEESFLASTAKQEYDKGGAKNKCLIAKNIILPSMQLIMQKMRANEKDATADELLHEPKESGKIVQIVSTNGEEFAEAIRSNDELPKQEDGVYYNKSALIKHIVVTSEDDPKEDTVETSTEETTLTSDAKHEPEEEAAKKEWLTVKNTLLPSMQMIMQMRIRKDQLMKADGSDATADEPLNGPTEEDESEDTEASSEDKSKEDVAEGTMVQDEDTHVAGATAEQNPMPEESKSGRFKVKKRVHMMQEEAVNEDLAIVDEFLKEEEEAWCKGKLTAENETASLSEDESDEESAEDTTTEDENTAVEATTEGKDEVWEEKILPEEEKMSTVSEDESADESTDTATGDESTEEPGDPATTEDETAAEKETGLTRKAESKHENAEDEIENKDTAMVSSTDHESESEEAVESLKVDDGEETDATSEDDSDEDLNATTNEEEEENDVTSNDLSNEPSEIATTEDEFLVERETAATSEHELTEGTYEASTAEDENVAVESSMVATSERESEEDEVVEKGTVTDEEKIPAISAEESEGENNHTNKLSEEPDRAASAEDKTAVSEEISSAGKGDSKDETAVEATDNEEAVKAEDADNSEEIGAVTENDSGEDLDATTNEDETTEEDDTTEPAEETTEDERVIETEIAVSTENEPNRGAAAEENVEGTTSDNEAEDYGAAEEAATTEHDSDTAVAVNTASASESESEDEVSEAKESAVTSEDELKKAAVEVAQEEAAEDVTDAEHEFNKDTSSDESDVKGTDEKLSEGEIAEQKEIAATSENEMAEEADETSDESDKTESSEKIGESSANEECKEEENDEDNSKKLVEGETTGDESEEPGKEAVESGENELTCEDCTEALTTEGETEKHETTEEDSGQPEAGENETDESDSREESEAEGTSAGEEAEETQTGKVESTDDTEDESEQDEGQNAVSESEDNSNKPESGCPESDVTCQEDTNDVVELKPEEDEEMEEKSETKEEIRENNPEDDVTQCECINIPDGSHDNNEEDSNASEKEDEETETPNEDWSEKQGDSADGEDEAEEDSDEPGEESGDIQLPLVTSKIDNQDVANIVPKEALKPLDTLIKKTAESEDGTYADIEDSEPEINSQDDIKSLETKSVKKKLF
uniref:Uncharacterized protein n=2 Tax=Astatotilapia calliptera TaxID=8154 RepID=A0A3P8PJU2_ASTCA